MKRHTEEEIEQAAKRLEEWLDELDPATTQFESTEDLARIAAASDALIAGEARLRKAVESARGNGRSWNEIAVALGVSRQAARQRFSHRTSA
jgi:hypothetical protein